MFTQEETRDLSTIMSWSSDEIQCLPFRVQISDQSGVKAKADTYLTRHEMDQSTAAYPLQLLEDAPSKFTVTVSLTVRSIP